jgi:hypothetical protein
MLDVPSNLAQFRQGLMMEGSANSHPTLGCVRLAAFVFGLGTFVPSLLFFRLPAASSRNLGAVQFNGALAGAGFKNPANRAVQVTKVFGQAHQSAVEMSRRLARFSH